MKVESGEIKHKVYVVYGEEDVSNNICWDVIERAVLFTLKSEAVDKTCEVNVLITDDCGIRGYNQNYRGIDKATDVLSFPMQAFLKAGWDGLSNAEIDEDTGDLPLGDIIISTQSVDRQAEEYGNSTEYETAYLIIHSTLHLLGYDHDNEFSEKTMHEKNKAIMIEMGFDVNDK